MELKTKLLFAAPIVLLILGAVSPVYAWDYGGGGCNWGCGYHHHYWGGCDCCGHLGGGGCEGCGDGRPGLGLLSGLAQSFGLWSGNGEGYYAGQQDAIYDHENNLVYTDQPSCLSCHSQLYLDGFKHGYDHQWNSYQAQESTQGTSINIYGNNNFVNTNQYSGHNQQGPDFNPNCWGSCDGGP